MPDYVTSTGKMKCEQWIVEDQEGSDRHLVLRHCPRISVVKPSRRAIFQFIEYHSTCFGRSFRPSSGVQDCTHSIRYMSYRLVDCLAAELQFHLVPASKQSTNLYDIHLMLYVQSRTPDDGRKDPPKHVEWYSVNSKIVHLIAFTIEKAVWYLVPNENSREDLKRLLLYWISRERRHRYPVMEMCSIREHNIICGTVCPYPS
jgi:hypothetical protein